ncbi:phage head-tail connector protein [Paraliobacillus sp. X-1268]|uniref:phage head-tail connector protein n=1 Tax=Paraliobacillus sp. X-1268 TaxID=2213193 RepID=UPI000E3B9032|nr:phage head-tail connector protein [Paraliobacillus sp. X-1268]
MAELENIKALLGIDESDTSKDGVINLYISRATNYTKNYLKVEEIPPALTDVIEDIAIFKYKQKGIENIKSEGKGSLSETYMESISDDIINQLNSHRKVRVL